MKNPNNKEQTRVVYLILFLVVSFYMYYAFTKFEKVITLKSEFTHTAYKYGNTFVSDQNNNVYKIHNNALLLSFNAVEMLSMLEKGRTFKITGYGVRVPWLGLYPNIISVTNVI